MWCWKVPIDTNTETNCRLHWNNKPSLCKLEDFDPKSAQINHYHDAFPLRHAAAFPFLQSSLD